jgi:hypothetical protein
MKKGVQTIVNTTNQNGITIKMSILEKKNNQNEKRKPSMTLPVVLACLEVPFEPNTEHCAAHEV